jgi:hypothetical protein
MRDSPPSQGPKAHVGCRVSTSHRKRTTACRRIRPFGAGSLNDYDITLGLAAPIPAHPLR